MLHQKTDRGPWQLTATGNAFFVLDPRPEDVRISDIALALGRECRYNGQLRLDVPHYSVAQHAVLVSTWMQEDGFTPMACYAGLHHDSAEAYTGDVIAQVKEAVPEFKAFEKRIEDAVFRHLGVDMSPLNHAIVKKYDRIAFATEVRDLLPENVTGLPWGLVEPARENWPIEPWSSQIAQEVFAVRHLNLLHHMADFKEEETVHG